MLEQPIGHSHLSRRELLGSLALLSLQGPGVAPRLTLAIHQQTSAPAGYRGSLEGWARAGIQHVELSATMIANSESTEACHGYMLQASIDAKGRFTMTNRRNGFSKTYESR